jgi:hypothetical protein
LQQFTFSGANQITLTPGQTYYVEPHICCDSSQVLAGGIQAFLGLAAPTTLRNLSYDGFAYGVQCGGEGMVCFGGATSIFAQCNNGANLSGLYFGEYNIDNGTWYGAAVGSLSNGWYTVSNPSQMLSTFGGKGPNAAYFVGFSPSSSFGSYDACSGTGLNLTDAGTITVGTNLTTATFTITGPESFSGSGTSATFLATTGSYTITFGGVAGYITPSPQTQTLAAGSSLTFNGLYTILGIDTLSAVSLSEWHQINQSGRTFFIVPAYGGGETGEGLFPQNQLRIARHAGFKVAAYCLLNFHQADQPQQDGTVKWSGTWQAQKALKSVGNEQQYLNFMAIDIETGSFPISLCQPPTYAACIQRIHEAVQAVKAANLTPIIYTNRSDWPKITGFTGNTSTPFSSLWLWDSIDDFSPTLTLDGPYAPTEPNCTSYVPDPTSLHPWRPFGGWPRRVGKQYNIGCNRQGTYLPGIAVLVDLDVFDPSVYPLN